MKRNELKIMFAIGAGAFDALAGITGTYAWFVMTRVNNASAMYVQMYTHELDMSYRVYKYDDNLKEAIDATGLPDALTLPKYDSVIKSRNVNTPIILEFIVTGVALEENIPLYINTHCQNTTTTDRVLSNIVQLQFSSINSITSSDTNIIYNESLNYFDENSIPEITFKNGNNKTQDVVYTLTNYQDAVLNNSLKIYIKLDYSIDLIDQFEFSITDSTTTSFNNDLTLINCYTDENN